MILKLKSLFYRYTGIYLAQKEEDAHMALESTLESAKARVEQWGDVDLEDSLGVEIGSWQAHHGFARPMITWHWSYRFKHPTIYPVVSFIANIHCGLRALKWDVQRLPAQIRSALSRLDKRLLGEQENSEE